MNIMLVYGGKSCEHDISIITAGLAKRYFDGTIYCCYLDSSNKAYLVSNNVTPQLHSTTSKKKPMVFNLGENYITVRHSRWRRRNIKIDCAVNCCHGSGVEDGSVVGLLSLTDIPVVGSDVIGSAIAMDKIQCKRVLDGLQLPTVEGVELRKTDKPTDFVEQVRHLGLPIIIKPSTLGSSIGISVIDDYSQLDAALSTAFAYDNRVLVEKALTDFYELNCSAMLVSNKVLTSNVDMPMSSGQILTFADKYLTQGKGMTNGTVAPKTHQRECSRLSRQIFVHLNLSGVVRVDFLVDRTTDKLYVNEVNTIPGSLAYSLWSKIFTLEQFGRLLVSQAVANHQFKKQMTSQYNSSVLNNTILPKNK